MSLTMKRLRRTLDRVMRDEAGASTAEYAITVLADVVPGTPFLLSPSYEYDVALNGFFQTVEVVGSQEHAVGLRGISRRS